MTDQQLYEKLSDFITENKRGLFDRIAPLRTRHVTAVMEDIHQSQNASAVLRTCDLVGVQDVHVIENRNTYKLNPDVTLGSSKWVDLYRYNKGTENSMDCIRSLRSKGYRIIATSPHADAHTPVSIELQRPMAIFFGTELDGLSEAVLEEADEHLYIPMYGFTESFNISASAAIVLFTVMERLRNSAIEWQLDEGEMLAIKLKWTRTMIQHVDHLEKRLRSDHEGK